MADQRAVPLTCHGHSRPITHLSFSQSNPPFLLSACKDLNPMLRDGATGDWIGTFLGHKGAVWSSRIRADGALAVTGSADFTAKAWDTLTGACVATFQENHIVRAVAVRENAVFAGGMERKVNMWDLETQAAQEIGAGVHTGTVKSLVTTGKTGLVSASDDKMVRWWDVRQQAPVAERAVEGLIGSCELNDVGRGEGTLSVAAGNSVYFFDGTRPGELLKQVRTEKEVSCVAVSSDAKRFVTGSSADTWVRVWDLESEELLETGKGHHGPVWTVSYSPDGKLYATGSEDGTIKLWKATKEPYGLWR